jgi:DNA mismatch repair ATPase MutS
MDKEQNNEQNIQQILPTSYTNDIVDNLINNKLLIVETEFGVKHLKEMLNYIIDDFIELNHRQDIIIDIVKKQESKIKLTKILKQINNKKIHISEWFQKIDEQSDLSFNVQYLNFDLILSGYNNLKCYSAYIMLFIYIFIFIIFRMLGLIVGIRDFFKIIYLKYVEILSLLLTSSHDSISAMITIVSSFVIIYQVYLIFNTFDSCIIHSNKCKQIKENYLMMFDVIDNIGNLFDCDIFLQTEKKQIGKDIDDLLNIFYKSASIGTIINAQNNISKYIKKIEKLLNYVGMLDALIAISGLISLSGNIVSPFCLPVFIEENNPILKISGLWNPIMKYEHCILNNFNIDQNLNKLTLITGPCRSGKTMYIESILINVLMAQTWGVCSCNKMILTPFYNIVNIPKNVPFNDQLDMCVDICNYIADNKDYSILVIMDELFNGANFKDMCSSSYSIYEHLSKYKNIITIGSTYFNQVCTIENIQYVKFDAIINQSGKHELPYKVATGISTQCTIIEQMENKGFNDIVVKNALLKWRSLN